MQTKIIQLTNPDIQPSFIGESLSSLSDYFGNKVLMKKQEPFAHPGLWNQANHLVYISPLASYEIDHIDVRVTARTITNLAEWIPFTIEIQPASKSFYIGLSGSSTIPCLKPKHHVDFFRDIAFAFLDYSHKYTIELHSIKPVETYYLDRDLLLLKK